MRDIDRALRDAFVEAMRPYLAGRLEARGIAPPAGWEETMRRATDWLERSLIDLLGLPPDEQRRGPLEVFQEAIAFPTAALAEAGRRPAARDPVAVAALPGDLFDLAPASSQDLGEEAWRAHLAWGAAKAAAVAGERDESPELAAPSAGLLVGDLMDRSRIEPVVAAAGLRPLVWPDAGAVTTAGLVIALVDLEHPDAVAVIARLAPRTMTVAFGPHVDEAAFDRARAAGASEVLVRSVFFRRLPGLLPRLA